MNKYSGEFILLIAWISGTIISLSLKSNMFFSLSCSFEASCPKIEIPAEAITQEHFHSGNQSFKFNKLRLYGATFSSCTGDIAFQPSDMLQAEFYCYVNDTNINPTFVISFENKDSTILWLPTDIRNYIHNEKVWTKITASAHIPEIDIHDTTNFVKLYVWNKDSSEFYIDDLKIQVFPPFDER